MDTAKVLSINDFVEVDDFLEDFNFTATKYHDLGVQLGLSPNTLEIIEEKNKGNVTGCLKDCLKAWLKKQDNLKKIEPTYNFLIKALRKIGEIDTADGICKKVHSACCILQRYSSNHSIIEALPRLPLFLHIEGVIGKMLLPATGAAEVLMSAVQESVCADYHNLEKFAAVLQKFSFTAAFGTLMRKDYIEKFPTEVNNDKEKDTSIKLNSVDQFISVRSKFASTVTDFSQEISHISPDLLKRYLCCGYSYLAHRLNDFNTTDDMLELVCSDHCSLINVSLLENIARYFKVDKAIALIDEYKESLQEFKSLQDLVNKQLFAGSPLNSETITFVVDRSVSDYTLNDVQLLLTFAFKELAPHVTVKVIKEANSFIVICSFPLTLSEQLIVTAGENIELLQEKGVKKLTIGHYTVFDNDEVDKDASKEAKSRSLTDEEEVAEEHDSQSKLEQIMISQDVQLLNKEQELICLKKKIQILEARVEELITDKALNDYISLQEKYKGLLKEKEELSKEVLKLRKQVQKPLERENIPIIFEDDVYGDIVIDHPLIVKIVKTRQFQRLKDIKQLGYTYLNIPKATYSRLQHSIGMYYLAGKYVKRLQRQSDLEITECDVLCVQIAALCYNLGFGPFSHTFEFFLNETFPNKDDKPWQDIPGASVKMIDHMINENPELQPLFKKFLENPDEDILFIKDLIKGDKRGQRKDKEFLYEIVHNKDSDLDVCMIDYTTRDAAVLGMKVSFKWRVFINRVRVLECSDHKLHICFQEDDLDIYNDLFRTRHSIYRELYYLRKNRIVAAMIERILVKSSKTALIRDKDRMVTVLEATESMPAYTRLTDGVLNLIRSFVTDAQAQVLLDSLDTLKLIAQIGYISVGQGIAWNIDDMKQHIVAETKIDDIADFLIIDPIKTGFENHHFYTQHYYSNDNKTGKWDNEWAKPPDNMDIAAPWRIFLISGDEDVIKQVQSAVEELSKRKQLVVKTYSKEDNDDLMPKFQITGSSCLLAQV